MGRGVVLSMLGGAVAAGLWAMIASLTGLEAGIVAWVVGVLAGIGMMAGRGRATRRSPAAGVIAAGIAVLAILAGKYAAVHVIVQETLEAQVYRVEDAKAELAWEVCQQMEDQGRELSESDDGPPREAVAEADRLWRQMTPGERERFVAERATAAASEREEARPLLTVLAFAFSFGLFDLVWVGLAVSTAYKAGSSGMPGAPAEDAAAAEETAPAGMGFWRPGTESPASGSLPFARPTDVDAQNEAPRREAA